MANVTCELVWLISLLRDFRIEHKQPAMVRYNITLFFIILCIIFERTDFFIKIVRKMIFFSF